MAKLIIKRANSWVHKKQSICIFCDNEYKDCVKNNENKIFELTEGMHTVAVKMTSYLSKPIQVNLKNDQPTTIELLIPKWIIFGDILSAAIVALYLTMRLLTDITPFSSVTPIILAFVAIYMIYNIIFVRKRYFRLNIL